MGAPRLHGSTMDAVRCLQRKRSPRVPLAAMNCMFPVLWLGGWGLFSYLHTLWPSPSCRSPLGAAKISNLLFRLLCGGGNAAVVRFVGECVARVVPDRCIN